MPTRILLDAHIAPRVARLLRDRGIDAASLREWQGGQYLSGSDEGILRAAHLEERTLVTYDLGSIPTLLRYFSESGSEHSGVIFISRKTIQPDEIAALAEAILRLLSLHHEQDLRNLVLFLSS